MTSPKISLRAIGREIRKSQKAIRAAIRVSPKATQRRLSAKIRKLDRHYREINDLCRTWNRL